jgi:hypothetical protein
MKLRIQVLIFFALTLGLTACKKYNQVDNSGTVKTPYILFVGGYNGTLHKTNDALYFNTLFNTDHPAVRQILVADTMLLFLKQYFHFSKNDGRAFQQSNNHPRNFEDLFSKYYLPNQALFDQVTTTVYLCSNSGLERSDDNGETFTVETNWSATPPPAVIPKSITQIENNNIFFIQDSAEIFRQPVGGSWSKISQATFLPTDTTTWYISHRNNTLYAVDFRGMSGIYYSDDEGVNWTATSGIPKKHKILFAKQTLSRNNTFFAGTDSAGLWRLDGTNFIPSGQGIPWYAKVHAVVGKKVVYRTDVERYYHFCATDVGLYISENDGLDWRLLREGAYSTLY